MYGSRINNQFIVWKESEKSCRCIPKPRGLYNCDMTQIQGTILATSSSIIITNGTMTNEPVELLLAGISTVDNLENYTHFQIEQTKRARKF